MTRTLIRTLLVLTLPVLVWGCGSDDDPTEVVNKLTGTFSISDGDAMAPEREVSLTYDVAEADSMRFCNEGEDWCDWEAMPPVKGTYRWILDSGDGMKTVEAEFKSVDGRSVALEDDIELDTVRTRILILDDNGSSGGFERILGDAGYTYTNGGYYEDYTNTDFSAYDLVILLYGYDYGYEIDLDVQAALKTWVQAGGVLLTTEWFTYSYDDVDIDTLLEILPLTYNDDYCDDGGGVCPETYTRMVDHPVTAGLPATFVTPDDWTYSFLAVNPTSLATDIQVLFEGSNSGAALGVGTFGSGHTLNWSMAGEYDGSDIWSAETERIVENIAAFAD